MGLASKVLAFVSLVYNTGIVAQDYFLGYEGGTENFRKSSLLLSFNM